MLPIQLNVLVIRNYILQHLSHNDHNSYNFHKTCSYLLTRYPDNMNYILHSVFKTYSHESKQLLTWLYSNEYSDDMCIDILNVWIDYSTGSSDSHHFLDYMSRNGKMRILDWWFIQSQNNKLSIQWCDDAEPDPNNPNYYLVWKWWINSGMNKWRGHVVDNVVRSDRRDVIDVLNLFIENYNEPHKFYYFNAIEIATRKNNIDILNWFLNSAIKYQFKFYMGNAVKIAYESSDIDTLNWWMNNREKIMK